MNKQDDKANIDIIIRPLRLIKDHKMFLPVVTAKQILNAYDLIKKGYHVQIQIDKDVLDLYSAWSVSGKTFTIGYDWKSKSVELVANIDTRTVETRVISMVHYEKERSED